MRRPPRIAVLIAVLAAAAVWVAFDLRRAPDAAGKASAQATQDLAAAPMSKDPTIPERSTLGRIASDPFSAPPLLPPTKPSSTAAAAPPPPPVAPPLPFRFAGQFYRGSEAEVYLGKGEDIFPVKEGDTLEGQYKVEAVTPSEVRFLHVPSGTTQTMQFSALKEPDAAPQAAPAKAPTAPSAIAGLAPTLSSLPAAGRPAQLRWEGPASARAGASFDVALRVTSGEQIRAAPMQVRFDPAVLESVSVRPGRYFRSERASNFGYRVNPEGSIFIGVSNQKPGSASDAEMLVLTFKPKRAAASAEITVSALNLQGTEGRTIAYNGVTPFRTTIAP